MDSHSNSNTPLASPYKRHHYFSERTCSVCGTDETCMWRRGPEREVLCNKCGLQLKRKQGKHSPEQRKRKQPKLSFLESPSLDPSAGVAATTSLPETTKRRKMDYDSSLSNDSSVFLLENSCESTCSSTTLTSVYSAISTPNFSPLPELDSFKELDFSKDVSREPSKDWSTFLAEYDAIFESIAKQVLSPQQSTQTNNFGLLQL